MQYVNDEEMIRREASVPVSSRIDVRTLAEICSYFISSNVSVRSVSQLVSWSAEMLLDILKDNDKLPRDKPTIEAAYQYLESGGLMQRGMKRKVASALVYEHLRAEGVNPASYDYANKFKSMHSNNNWSGAINDQRPVAHHEQQLNATTNAGNIKDKIAAHLNKVDNDRLKEDIERQKKRWKEMRTLDDDGFVVTPTSGDCASGVVTEEDMIRYKAEKEDMKQLAEDSCEIRTRTQAKIEEYRRKRDKEKEEELSRMI